MDDEATELERRRRVVFDKYTAYALAVDNLRQADMEYYSAIKELEEISGRNEGTFIPELHLLSPSIHSSINR